MYDINQYITQSKMSEKKRLLVEGREDKSHITNLLKKFEADRNVKIDTAETIKGDCKATLKNNRAKIDKIHNLCKATNTKNLFFLRDREFYKFQIDSNIQDHMPSHESDGNLSWTIGHSLENYFLKEKILTDAFRYLSSSEYKNEALILLTGIRKKAIRFIATVTLAASEMKKSSYPAGVILWQDISIENLVLKLNMEAIIERNNTDLMQEFKNLVNKYKAIIENVADETCERLCRGHTALILIQRVFSACLHCAIEPIDSGLAKRTANTFSQHREENLSTALAEAWIRFISLEAENDYPCNVIKLIQ